MKVHVAITLHAEGEDQKWKGNGSIDLIDQIKDSPELTLWSEPACSKVGNRCQICPGWYCPTQNRHSNNHRKYLSYENSIECSSIWHLHRGSKSLSSYQNIVQYTLNLLMFIPLQSFRTYHLFYGASKWSLQLVISPSPLLFQDQELTYSVAFLLPWCFHAH